MILLPVLLSLAAILFPSSGALKSVSFESLSTGHQQIQKEIVDKHNDLRSQVSPPATNMLKMEWSSKAQKTAQAWANKCTLSHSPSDSRKAETNCGENLFMSSSPVIWSDAVQSWYDEYKDFDYGKGATSPGQVVGHYTQVVWYSSYLLGCAVAQCPGKKYEFFYVCHYCPAGNIQPRENQPYEKGASCAKCPNSCSNKLCTNPCKYTNAYSNCPDLKKQVSCNHNLVKKSCKASCQCTNEVY